MKIFLDDDLISEDRRTPAGWKRVINVKEFKELVEHVLDSREKIEAISFDNDLGEPGLENEGRGALKWLMNKYPEIMKEELEITIHSQNSEGKEAMVRDLKFWREHVDELIEAKDRPDPWSEIKIK